jgi:hypothetical protein
MDRSEIGPYLGGLRSISRVVPQTQPRPGTSPDRATSRGPSTNSALPGHLRGGAISPKAPRPQTWTTAEIGLPQTWTARRSVPTSEVFGRYPESYHKLNLARAPPQIGLHPGVLPQTQPCLGTSEVGRFLRKRHVRRHGPLQRLVRRRHGPLGDRSLPRRSSGYIHGRNTGSYHGLSQHDRSHSKSFRLRLARGKAT